MDLTRCLADVIMGIEVVQRLIQFSHLVLEVLPSVAETIVTSSHFAIVRYSMFITPIKDFENTIYRCWIICLFCDIMLH